MIDLPDLIVGFEQYWVGFLYALVATMFFGAIEWIEIETVSFRGLMAVVVVVAASIWTTVFIMAQALAFFPELLGLMMPMETALFIFFEGAGLASIYLAREIFQFGEIYFKEGYLASITMGGIYGVIGWLMVFL